MRTVELERIADRLIKANPRKDYPVLSPWQLRRRHETEVPMETMDTFCRSDKLRGREPLQY